MRAHHSNVLVDRLDSSVSTADQEFRVDEVFHSKDNTIVHSEAYNSSDERVERSVRAQMEITHPEFSLALAAYSD